MRVFVDNQGQEPVWFDSLYIKALKPKKALIVQENHYAPYGNPILPLQYLAEAQALNPSMYQGKELDSLLQAYEFEARLYDPLTGRFMSSDPADQFASGYIGMGNNPVIGADPDGKWVIPVLIGAFFGGFSGWQIGKAQGARGWDLLPYILGGAMFGAASGGVGHAVATSGIAFSQTLSIAASSTLFSAGMYAVSGNKSDITTSLGAASYNWSEKEFGFLGKKGNSLAENLGYGFGALANIQDIFAGFHGTAVDVKARPKLAGHSETSGSYDGNNITISVGPADQTLGQGNGLKWEMEYVKRTLQGKSAAGENVSYIQKNHPKVVTRLNNVNGKRLVTMTNRLNSGKNLINTGPLKYGLLYGCVNYNARALLLAGVLNVNAFLPVTAPLLLNAELAIRQLGIYASPYLTTYE